MIVKLNVIVIGRLRLIQIKRLLPKLAGIKIDESVVHPARGALQYLLALPLAVAADDEADPAHSLLRDALSELVFKGFLAVLLNPPLRLLLPNSLRKPTATSLQIVANREKDNRRLVLLDRIIHPAHAIVVLAEVIAQVNGVDRPQRLVESLHDIWTRYLVHYDVDFVLEGQGS